MYIQINTNRVFTVLFPVIFACSVVLWFIVICSSQVYQTAWFSWQETLSGPQSYKRMCACSVYCTSIISVPKCLSDLHCFKRRRVSQLGKPCSTKRDDFFINHTGWVFYWFLPKKLKYGKPRLGESTLA